MTAVWTNWRVLLLVAVLLLAGLFITLNGLEYGIDFKGGTSFQIKLAESVSSPEQMAQIVSIISQRMDWTGLKDTTVTSIGNDLVLADIAETNPQVVEQLESLLLRQGKFEATLKGELLFTGSDFVQISKDPARGYGVNPSGNGTLQWVLPFILKADAAKRFTQKTFHQCEIIGSDPTAGRQYDCEKTYFFIDRPEDAVIVLPVSTYASDRALLLSGSVAEDIPPLTDFEDLLLNARVPVVRLNSETLVGDSNALLQLESLALTHARVLVPNALETESKTQLQILGFTLTEIASNETVPFVWTAIGAKQVISLSPDVTNLSPYVADINQAKVYSELIIRGSAATQEDGLAQLSSLVVLLESGSLPIPVESISKETISPQLGESFLESAAWMGLAALLAVSVIIFIRYRQLSLVLPIMATSLFEAFLVLGFAALIRWNLDLASIAGIIAAIGTGVNDQIVITDELLKRKGEESVSSEKKRIQRAFFIVMAAASTMLAVMLPIIIFGFGLGKLVGFAITTTIGVLVGVLLTRPAYGEVARDLIARTKN